jgi:hypothetical protein
MSLSESEHRLRDARALIALRDFLPPESSGQTTYATITLDESSHTITQWPRIPSDAGIVVLGRPSLFGIELKHQMEVHWTPSLGFRLISDDPKDECYRTIEACGTKDRYSCPPFAVQRRTAGKQLFDYGIFYSGWSHDRPIVLLAGTSTVGTWACVKYAVEYPKSFDVRWQEDVQGIVRASVDNVVECFQDVRTESVQLLAPCRIWMEGRDLPSLSDWRKPSRLRLDEMRNAGKFDLQILINDRPIFQKARTHIPALVLLALVSAQSGRPLFCGGSETHASILEVLRAIFDFLHLGTQDGNGGSVTFDDFVQDRRNHVAGILKELVKQIREQGGIASFDAERMIYSICARPLPPFLPAIRS